ncbi:MAG: ATP-binding protein [Candidatus Zixiibacteriota bacterium]
MKIERCEIKRFGKLKNFKAEFAPGLNLVKGPNEAGKTTLVEALGTGLFGDPQDVSREVKEKTSWGADKKFELVLELEDGGERWQLSKDFEKGQVKLEKLGAHEKWEELSEVDEILAKHLGLAKKELYLSTSFIRQGELAIVSENPRTWREKLEEAVTGGNEQVLAQGVAEKLADRLARYGEEGELGTSRKYKKEIEYQLSLVTEEVKTLLANRTDLAEIEKSYVGVRRQVEDLKKRLEASRQPPPSEGEKLLLEEKQTNLTARLKNLDEAEQTVKQLREEAAKGGDVSREDIARLDEIEGKMRLLEVEHGELTEGSDTPRFPSPVPFLIGLGATIASLIMAFLSAPIWWAGVAFGAAWSGLAGFSFLHKVREAARKEWEFKNSSGKKENVIGGLEQLQRNMNELLARYRVTSAAELRNKVEHSRERAGKITEATLRYENLLGGHTRAELEADLEATKTRLSDLKEKPSKKHDAGDVDVLEEKLIALEEEKHNLETARNAIARRIEQSEDGVELKVALEERLEEENKKINDLERKLIVYLKTYELWEEARKRVLSGAADVLDEEVSKQLAEITGGRYTKARFDKENLSFEVYSEEREEFVNPHKTLSAGACDQLYLAARLALLKFIFPDQKPVLILDDPFGNFDPQRRQKAGELLVKLASEYQILLLTSQDYFDHLSASKIEL